MAHRSLVIAALLLLPACGDSSDPGADSELPACEGASLFQDEGCMTAVMDRCRAITDRDGCVSATPIETDQWQVLCGWTLVTPLIDEATCELAPTFGRCEAGLAYHDGAAALGVCDPDGAIFEGIGAFVAEREFVQVDTSVGPNYISGALGPWALIDAEPGVSAVCGDNWSPAGPSWCSCADAVCDQP